LGEETVAEDLVKEALDLCLECRACKTECPVGVDVARFKSEFLARYWKRRGVPWKSRLLGHAHELARWGSAFAPFSGWIANTGIVRSMNERILGIDARRAVPQWSRETLEDWFFGREAGPVRVLLFNDTFTNYYNPSIGIAAARLLDSAGFPVALAPNGCCGRPLISQGLLEEATEAAEWNTRALSGSDLPLLFCEPSCLSAVREDVPSLLRGGLQRRALEIAKRAMLWEEFVERECGSLRFRPGPRQILLHGHCHQKSMGMVEPVKRLLARVPGARVVDLDAGCCGMAGSFGYSKQNFELSKAIGERKLLPAARGMIGSDVLVAAGVSCRHQVDDFTGRRAMHPAELLRELVESSS
jgi:Fe-S oxidoreductase